MIETRQRGGTEPRKDTRSLLEQEYKDSHRIDSRPKTLHKYLSWPRGRSLQTVNHLWLLANFLDHDSTHFFERISVLA